MSFENRVYTLKKTMQMRVKFDPAIFVTHLGIINATVTDESIKTRTKCANLIVNRGCNGLSSIFTYIPKGTTVSIYDEKTDELYYQNTYYPNYVRGRVLEFADCLDEDDVTEEMKRIIHFVRKRRCNLVDIFVNMNIENFE